MPIYEYECNHCGNSFEKMVPFSKADQVLVCPKCEGKDTQNKISLAISFGTNRFGDNKFIRQQLRYFWRFYLRRIMLIRPCAGFPEGKIE